jgi:competence protein ComFC
MPDVPLVVSDTSEARAYTGLLRSERLSHWLDTALDLVFPPRCVGCGRVDTPLCARCDAEIASSPLQLHLHHEQILNDCAASGAHDGKLREAVQALKYNNARGLALPLARQLMRCQNELNWRFDTVTPVPIGTERLKERGYNQAELIARAFARQSGADFQAHLLRRQRETRSQVGLDAKERQANVEGAFIADNHKVSGKAILIIDDVYTTGATLGACAAAVRDAGATAVYALTVTVASPHQQ